LITETSFSDRYPRVELGQVVDFLDYRRRPITASDRIPGPYPYYGANGQQDSVADFIFEEPLILLAEDGGHFDHPDRGIANPISGKTWVNNHAHVLRPRDGLDIRYLCRVLENYDVRPFVAGTTRSKLTKAGASRIIVPMAPLQEQRQIAAILDQADALRAQRRAALSLLEELGSRAFDLVVEEALSAEHDGLLRTRCAFVSERDLPLCMNTSTIRFKQALNSCRLEYLAAWIQSAEFRRQITRLVTGTAQQNFGPSHLKQIAITIPPLCQQERLSSHLSAISSLQATHRTALAELDALFASLQHRAFRGEL